MTAILPLRIVLALALTGIVSGAASAQTAVPAQPAPLRDRHIEPLRAAVPARNRASDEDFRRAFRDWQATERVDSPAAPAAEPAADLLLSPPGPRWVTILASPSSVQELDVASIRRAGKKAFYQEQMRLRNKDARALYMEELDCDTMESRNRKTFYYLEDGTVLPEYSAGREPARPGTRGYDAMRYVCDNQRDATVAEVPPYPVNWVNVVQQRNGMIWQVDLNSLGLIKESWMISLRDSRTPVFWSRRDFSAVKSVRYRYAYSLDSVDCGERKISRRKTIYYLPGQTIGTQETNFLSSGKDIGPDSPEEAVLNFVCAR